MAIKLFAVIIFCFMQTTVMAQSLEKIMQAFNILCPYDIGSGCSIKSTAINNDYVEMTFIINENIITVKDFEDNKDTYAGTMARSFAKSSGSNELIERMVDEGYGLKLIIIGDTSGEQCEIPIPHRDLKNALSSSDEDLEEDQLTLSVVNASHKLPLKRGEATLKDIVLSDGTVAFVYDAPEAMMKQPDDSLFSVIRQEFDFAVTDYFEKKMLTEIMERGFNPKFCFEFGKKKKTTEIMLSARETASYMDKAGKKHEKEVELIIALMKLGAEDNNDIDVAIEENDIIVTMTVDDDMVNLISLADDDDDDSIVATDEMVKQVLSNTEGANFLFEAIAASNKNLVYNYVGKESGKGISLIIKNLSLVKALMNY